MKLKEIVAIGALGLAAVGCGDDDPRITGWDIENREAGVHGAALKVETEDDAICDYAAMTRPFSEGRFQSTNDEVHRTPVLGSHIVAQSRTEYLFQYEVTCRDDDHPTDAYGAFDSANIEFTLPH